ncbi:MAG TPA: hypothetical protein VGG06_10845 [Thermoanaerobaculia bacterium]|jgi:hypothetical protein
MSVLGQAVVTDPSAGRASGYVLVAASPSVDPEDAGHLAATPQVTDYLHLEASPGPFFSFYRLPSGAGAAVRRFVRGTRRGSYNRVVVHTLVVPEATLEALAGEPGLLWTRCRFRAPGGAELTPAALAEVAGEADLERLDDLALAPLDDPAGERAALVERRRDFLRQRWGDAELGERLRRVLAATLAGRRVLLPQGAEAEQLLAVAWSVLPPADRLATPWTTHLAAAAGALFQLACCPDPRTLRAGQDDPDGWVLPLDPAATRGAANPSTDDPDDDARALAAAVAGGEVDLEELDDGLRRYGVRLAARGRTRRWIGWLRQGGPRRLAGFADAGELARFFYELRLAPGERGADPWLSPAHLLACACGSVLCLHAAGSSVDAAVRAVLEVLVDTHWHAALLEPRVIAELAVLDKAAVPVAVALGVRGLPVPPAGGEDREVLLDLLLAAPPSAADPLVKDVLATLAVGLARCGSPRADHAFDALGSLPGGWDAVDAADFWTMLAGRPSLRVPAGALRTLEGLQGEDRRRIAELWLPRIARLEGRPGDLELAAALGALVDPASAEQRFQYNVGRLVLGMRAEGLDLVDAVARAGRLLRQGGNGDAAITPPTFSPYLKRAVHELLPAAPERRAAAVVRLLLSPSLPPSVKRVIETELCDASLERAGWRLGAAVPRLRELAARGPLLLRVAARLGEQWHGDRPAAEAFLRESAELGRFDAVAAFLRRSERRGASFLKTAAAAGDASLPRKLSRAVATFPLARRYLRAYLTALGEASALARTRR